MREDKLIGGKDSQDLRGKVIGKDHLTNIKSTESRQEERWSITATGSRKRSLAPHSRLDL